MSDDIQGNLAKLAIVGMAEQRAIARESIVDDFMAHFEYGHLTEDEIKRANLCLKTASQLMKALHLRKQ